RAPVGEGRHRGLDAAALDGAVGEPARAIDPELERATTLGRDLDDVEAPLGLGALADRAHRRRPALGVPPAERRAVGLVACHLEPLGGALDDALARGVTRPRRVAVVALGALHRPELEARQTAAGADLLPRLERPLETAGRHRAASVQRAHGIPRVAA